MINVVLIEDMPNIRLAQEKYLSAQEDIHIVFTAESTERFQEQMRATNQKVDVIISDIGLPGISGIEGIKWIKNHSPKTEVVMVSVYTDSDNIFKALCAGAVGYLAKNTAMNEIHEAIRSVMKGGSPMTPSIARKVIQHFNPEKSKNTEALSAKEKQVVQCIVDGLSYKLVADRLGISINTVRHYIRSIYKKLQINSKAELISKSYLKNLLPFL